MADEEYAKKYDEKSFWEKITHYGKSIGRELALKAVAMYYALQDADTPVWAKTVIIASLGYFIFPADAIPDLIPGAGFSDDAGAIAAAFATVLMYIKPVHKEKAAAKCDEWFGAK